MRKKLEGQLLPSSLKTISIKDIWVIYIQKNF